MVPIRHPPVPETVGADFQVPVFQVVTRPEPRARTETEVLRILRDAGAVRLASVRFRRNRSTIWSLTSGGRQLNLHRAFAAAPAPLLRRFAMIVMDGGLASVRSRSASEAVSAWPPLQKDLGRIRAEHALDSGRSEGRGVGPCCATEAQRRYLARLYRYLNRARFGGQLPARVPLRLSNRMTSRLGQMVPGEIDGRRRVLEIALNVDLMLAGNGSIRLDTLVHEMAHAADWLFDGEVGHGSTWRRWARIAGCEATACADVRIRRRRRGARVTRVPPLPLGARLIRVA